MTTGTVAIRDVLGGLSASRNIVQEAIDETYRLEAVKDALAQVFYQLDESRRESIRETGDALKPEYDNIEYMLSNVQNLIEGRIQELNPYYSEDQHSWCNEDAPMMVQMRQAREKGINYVALQGLSTEECDHAIRYISEHGLASMNYEATREALQEFRKKDPWVNEYRAFCWKRGY